MSKKSNTNRKANFQMTLSSNGNGHQGIEVEYAGPHLVRSNYWGSEQERSGFFMVTKDDEAFRLLVPSLYEGCLADIRTGKHAVVTLGYYSDMKCVMYMIRFEDYSNNPFYIRLDPRQVDLGGSILDVVSKAPPLIVYTQGCVEAAKMPVFVRLH